MSRANTMADEDETLAEPLLQGAAEQAHDAASPVYLKPAGQGLRRIETFSEDGKYFDSNNPVLERISRISDASTVYDEEHHQHHHSGDTFVATTMSLSKVILGSGMLVIPKAFQLLGVGLGVSVLGLVGLVTWFTIAGLVHRAGRSGKETYAGLVRATCGKPAKWGILFAVFTNCLGMCTALLIIFADILIGSPGEPGGLIYELVPGLSPDSLLLDKRVVLAALVLVLFLPLALQKNMAALAALNSIGVAAVAAFAASSSIAAGAAIYKGKAHPLPWLPDWTKLGDSTVKIISSLMAIGPVLLNADICHQSVFPTMGMLRPFSETRFSSVVALALGLCNVLYTLIAVTSIIAFGDKLKDDSLSNFDNAGLEPLIGALGAVSMSYVVRLSYFTSLVGSFILQLYPLRHCVMEVLLGSNFKTRKSTLAWRKNLSEDKLFLPVTLVLLLASYLLAVLIPSIWLVISLVGSTCSTLMGFIFPGLVMLMFATAQGGRHILKDIVSIAVVLLGAYLFVNGFVSLSF